MNTQGITRFIKTVGKGISKHGPEILTGIGIAGMVTTTVLAVKATPKALRLIEEAKETKHAEKLEKKDVVKVTWKTYIPAAVTGVASIACLIGSTSIHARRNAALVTAYQISTAALNEYKNMTLETVGEEKVKEIRDKIVKKNVDKIETPAPQSSTVIIGAKDECLFYDVQFGQYFYSTVEKVNEAKNKFNYQLLSGQYASLNELYDEFGTDRIDIGDSLGWNVSRHGMLDISTDRTQIAKNGKPCFVIEYHTAPEYDYWKE